jgi:hypothetical protein
MPIHTRRILGRTTSRRSRIRSKSRSEGRNKNRSNSKLSPGPLNLQGINSASADNYVERGDKRSVQENAKQFDDYHNKLAIELLDKHTSPETREILVELSKPRQINPSYSTPDITTMFPILKSKTFNIKLLILALLWNIRERARGDHDLPFGI